MIKKKVIIVGAFHEIIELAEDLGLKIVGLIDNEKKESYYGYKVLCNDLTVKEIIKPFSKIPLIITPDLPQARLKLYIQYKEMGLGFFSLISSCARISKSVIVDEGTIIQFNVNVSSESKIGKFVKLNTNCNVMHNSIIDNFTTVAPNAVILGNVKIGKFCYISANATILPNIKICDNSIIGAGAVVVKDCLDPGTYLGIPARRVERIKF